MYQHFDNVVTRKIQERRSSGVATIRAMERSRQRRSLPNNFMFTLRMVSGRQRLLVFANHGEEDEIYPLTTLEIAEAQKKDRNLKIYYKRNAKTQKKG